jgi:hypothetical protein
MPRSFQRILNAASRVTPAVAAWACLFGASVDSAQAEGWMFRRSYFSHVATGPEASPEAVPESRSAYRRAWAGTSPGFAARGAYRYNTVFLRSGNSVDVTVQREDWFEVNPYGRP